MADVSPDIFDEVILGVNTFGPDHFRHIQKKLHIIVFQLFNPEETAHHILYAAGGLGIILFQIIVQNVLALVGKGIAIIFCIVEGK